MRYCVLLLTILLAIPASGQSERESTGLLLMAHGGSEAWNTAIKDAVDLLHPSIPVSVAFGMADPVTLQRAVSELEEAGATMIRVIRLFVSAESFLPETEYAFGLRATKPDGKFMFEPTVLKRQVPVSLNSEGLLDAAEIGHILADRATRLSVDPGNESVLIIGHGPGDDSENEDWLAKMDRLADAVRRSADFHTVQVATLREDWTGKREKAERYLRRFVTDESAQGRNVLVIPFRLYGFGPYADVLEDLPYRADSLGFLPDSRITDWIESQYRKGEFPALESSN